MPKIYDVPYSFAHNFVFMISSLPRNHSRYSPLDNVVDCHVVRMHFIAFHCLCLPFYFLTRFDSVRLCQSVLVLDRRYDCSVEYHSNTVSIHIIENFDTIRQYYNLLRTFVKTEKDGWFFCYFNDFPIVFDGFIFSN